MKVRAVFLDRDGTINIEKNYLYRIEDFEWIEGAIEAIQLFNASGFRVIVVTNQAGVARGFYSCKDVEILHDHIQKLLAKEKAHIDAFFYCPDHPEGIVPEFRSDSECRKPKIGMYRKALKQFDVDASASYMIGDNRSDVEFGENAGLRPCLVRTGHGASLDAAWLGSHQPMIFENILDAARSITGKGG